MYFEDCGSSTRYSLTSLVMQHNHIMDGTTVYSVYELCVEN